MLLDMLALCAEAGTPGRLYLDLHGDDAVAATLDWAASRAVAVGAPEPLVHEDGRRCTYWLIDLAAGARVNLHSDWRIDAPVTMVAIEPGGPTVTSTLLEAPARAS